MSLRRLRFSCAVALLFAFGPFVNAAQTLSLDSPIQFFTNVASRLLRSELGVELNRIQIYPTNQYTRAVHRLLQVSANLYDAATNHAGTSYPYLPCVFRPLFAKTGPGPDYSIQIIGFAEVTNVDQVLSTEIRWIDAQRENALAPMKPTDMVYGVPIVVGARKGFPNFNEFSLGTDIQVSRALEFRRATVGGPPTETNEMYTLSISNTFGVEAWNSYSNAFPRDSRMWVEVKVNAVLTNELGEILVISTNPASSGSATLEIPAGSWPGYLSPYYADESFQLPLSSSFTSLSNATYLSGTRRFVPQTSAFERDRYLDLPEWLLLIGMKLRYALVDSATHRILDFVNLDYGEQPLNIPAVLQMDAVCAVLSRAGPVNEGAMWCTYALGGAGVPTATVGTMNQIAASLGMSDPPQWPPLPWDSREHAIDFFRAQFNISPLTYSGVLFARTNLFYAPYLARRTIYLSARLQANDPLVHYTIPDLTDYRDVFQSNRLTFVGGTSINLGRINQRCEPWGGSGVSHTWTATLLDPRVKDPMVLRSDDWDFPVNAGLELASLGRVHRGTPWQTIYLKSGSVDFWTWTRWLNSELPPYFWHSNMEALVSAPNRDWHLVSVLAPLFNTNPPRSLFSVNTADPALWNALLAGLHVWTNTSRGTSEQVVLKSGMPQVSAIIEGIARAQATERHGRFEEIGDILAVPELSLASPWLNVSNNPAMFIPEHFYEALPAQLLPALREDSIGSVVPLGNGVRVSFTGWEGTAYRFELSTNLLNWISWSTNVPAHGLITLELPYSSGTCFYRLVAE